MHIVPDSALSTLILHYCEGRYAILRFFLRIRLLTSLCQFSVQCKVYKLLQYLLRSRSLAIEA
jgi:hypothetical protein